MSNYPWKLKKGLLLCVLLSEPLRGLAKKNEANINWNKIGAKMEDVGMKIMVQTSSVKLCDFFNLFRVYRWINFVLEKILPMLPPPSAWSLDPTKTAFSKFYFPKYKLTFQSLHLACKKWLKSLKPKTERVERSEKLFVLLLFLSNSSKN